MSGCCLGSGKTRIAAELAGLVLQKKAQAKIVFLATTVALAQQQAGEGIAPTIRRAVNASKRNRLSQEENM